MSRTLHSLEPSARRRSGALLPLVAAVVAALGCASEPAPANRPAAPPPSSPAGPPPDQAPEPEDKPIVLKGSSRPDRAPREETRRSAANQAKVEELKRKAGEGGVTATWRDFTSLDGRFMVLMPSKPIESTETVQLRSGTLDVHVFKVTQEKPDERFFVVTYFDTPGVIPPSRVEQVLADAENARVRDLGGKLVESRSISVQGYPARESRIDAGTNISFRSRSVAVGARFFTISSVAPRNEAEARDLEKFLNSFKVTTEPKPVNPAGPPRTEDATPPPR